MRLAGYVSRDLLRNPRRTLASLAGVVVGVGLFTGLLFFIDGSGASMTRRALAPLVLDIQRVLTAPLGGGTRLAERVSDDALTRGQSAVVTLTVTNDGITAAHEVVVRDRPRGALEYAPGSTRLDGRLVADVDGAIPLSEGAAGTGLNLGTVPPRTSRTITYRVRAVEDAPSAASLPVHATVSTREAVTPANANTPRLTSLARQATLAGRLQGVDSADPLVFVDMSEGSISAHGASVPGPVKLFAFDQGYVEHYPDVVVRSGAIRRDQVLISIEAARALHVGVGDAVALELPGTAKPLSLVVSGLTDLSNAKPLFSSRQPASLEKFNYVPFTIVVPPGVYRAAVEPAFEDAAAERGSTVTSLPVQELDILLDRSKLNADPATALDQAGSVAQDVQDVAADPDFLIDNISNTLKVARGDASIAKRMFVFLGLPGAILAAILTAFAGTLLARAQQRDNALLRVRGASRRHLLHLLALRTIAVAGIGSVLGTALGFGSVLVLLGRTTLLEASSTGLAQSALIGIVGGVVVTAVALYVPGRNLITQDINQDLAIRPRSTPSWIRLNLTFLVLVAAGIAQLVAIRAGAFDIPPGSVYSGRSVSLPLHLLIAPIVAWLAGTLLVVHALHKGWARVGLRTKPRFGHLLPGVLWRSITRRLGALAGGVVAVGLVVGLGVMLACFATTYDASKASDSRFLVGSDVRLTPNPTNSAPHPTSLAGDLRINGAGGATAVVFSPENTVLTSKFNEDVATLAAIDPASFGAVSALDAARFAHSSAGKLMSALQAHPDGVLVNSALADGLKLKVGDDAELLLARGTDQQVRRPVRVLGLFTQFPGAPTGTDVVSNIATYERETGLHDADYFLIAAAEPGSAGLHRLERSLTDIPHLHRRFEVQTTGDAFDKDQSSLTALNVRGLLQLNSFFTFLMAVTATAMFVFGLLLQRRREYVTLRAQGLGSGKVQLLVLAEAGICATLGSVIGLIVGTAMASQFVHVLRPIFTLAPKLVVPVAPLAILGSLVFGATVISATAAAVLIGRLKPTELLREE